MKNDENIDTLIKQFGTLVGGQDLWKCLGFKTRPAFYKSVKSGKLKLNVFKVTGRRGWFALTDDVCKWLQNVSSQRTENEK